eukprot:comp16641_c0_seq1/m.14836 comp16641_c0_seq1/g.14836  ORF comp16641_c0_seq1/g.14836 comp16641_c0_seq1/m.14836 type:complete len:205 (-) comp16641_c0_seq1:230-844(-)
MRQLLAVAVAVACLPSVYGVSFELEAGSTRCLRQSLAKDALVKGDYKVSTVENQQINIKVQDEQGHTPFKKDNTQEGPLVFTADTKGNYEICFSSEIKQGSPLTKHECTLNLRTGIEAKDYDQIQEAEKLQPLELELRKLEELAESIANDMAYMKQREAEMRDTNESTNARVLYFSMFSMFCLCGLAAWQVYYLKKFFQSKKLI